MFFFFNDTATTEIYTLSLHDALPISTVCCWSDMPGRSKRSDSRSCHRYFGGPSVPGGDLARIGDLVAIDVSGDRKSTRLNSSHQIISYAVFCLKKKNSYSTERRCITT